MRMELSIRKNCEIASKPGAIGGFTHLRIKGSELSALSFQIGKAEDDASIREAHYYPEMQNFNKKIENLKLL